MIMTRDEKNLFYEMVAQFEGFRPRPYLCPSGVLTIGYGHTKGVKSSDIVTLSEAKKLLESDFDDVFTLLKSTGYVLEEHELFALADLIFNIGFGKFIKSSLPRLLNQYSHCLPSCSNYYRSLICDKIQKFVYYTDQLGKKQKSAGLVRRRRFETLLFRYCELNNNY